MVAQKELRTLPYRKENFEVVVHFYECKDSGEQFEDEKQLELTLNQVYNAYRAKHNIPLPPEIRRIREQYDISAAKMSEIMEFGPNLWRLYESGEMPTTANARYINQIKNADVFKNVVRENNELSDEEKEKIYAKIEKKRKNELVISDSQILTTILNKADRFSGYRNFQIEKFLNVLLLFATELKPRKVTLNKLFFYADFQHYKDFGISITGTTYRAIDFGPVPTIYRDLLNFAEKKGFITVKEEWKGDFLAEIFEAKKEADTSLFSMEELQTINTVKDKFKAFSATKITEYSHQEIAWIENKDNKNVIDYKYAYELKNSLLRQLYAV
jgi:uncharacterized phage-associated protein/DNA-binding transcriptional regulator YiaG